jgi:hypothetical protein
MADVATPSSNNQIPEGGSLAWQSITRSIGQAFSFVLFGVPEGRRPARMESAFDAWLPLIGLSTTMIAVGALAVGGIEWTPVRAMGAALAIMGLFALVFSLIAPAALDRTAPPARRKAGPQPVTAVTGLTKVADGVHCAQTPLIFYGLPMGARMTVLELGDGKLLVHSPIEATELLLDAVRELGEVAFIVAPNALHHMWVAEWARHFPEAQLVAAPTLEFRRSDIAWTTTLRGARPEVPWDSDVVDASVVEGHKLIEEIVLLHKPSGTLVVADMILNLGHRDDLRRSVRWVLELATMNKRPAPPPEWKLTLYDTARVRAAADRIESWSFDRIVVAHGAHVTEDAKAVFRDAFAFSRA